ncbi:hypothetical protein [Acinetobacter defluvii]|uniref:hypothetical protein n=1 Tax=Acinetobacter defluvii TaxID=1871111 RepID=UPI003AF42307
MSQTTKLCLTQSQRRKKLPLQNSYDPREFCIPRSTQDSHNYLLFTFYPLDDEQLKKVYNFSKKIDWQNYQKQLQSNYILNTHNFRQDHSLTLVDNLSLDQQDSSDYFLHDAPSQFNLAFSLLNKINQVKESIDNEIAKSYEGRSSYSHLILSQSMQNFLSKLNNEQIELVCHTANDYQNAYIEQNFTPISMHKLNVKTDKNEVEINENEQNNIEEKPISTITSLLYLILFVAIAFGLLYGFYFLFNHFEFIKFAVISIGIIIFLAIWSKK